jgi:hypothetical protein
LSQERGRYGAQTVSGTAVLYDGVVSVLPASPQAPHVVVALMENNMNREAAMAGAPSGIGPIEGIAPSPGAGPGRIVGLRAGANVLGRVPEGAETFGALKGVAGKDFNDAPTGAVLGADAEGLAVAAVYGPAAVTSPTDPSQKQHTTQGRVLDGNELRVIDPATGRDVEPGVVG